QRGKPEASLILAFKSVTCKKCFIAPLDQTPATRRIAINRTLLGGCMCAGISIPPALVQAALAKENP
ncbi:MAG: hypothetical protein ACKVQA_11705, partial [Burkholderiales bacterium]